MSNEFGETKKAVNSGSISGANNIDNMIDQLDQLGDIFNNDSVLNGFGPIESFLQGSADPQDRTNLQSMFRAVTSGFSESSDAATARGIRDTFTDKFFEDVAAALEGQGQVSNFERQAGEASISTLRNPSITDEQAETEVNRLKDSLAFRSYRSTEGISIDENGFETQGGANVVTYRGKDGRIYSQEVSEPTVYVPEWASDRTIQSTISRIPLGSKFVYKGQIYTREDNAQASELTEN